MTGERYTRRSQGEFDKRDVESKCFEAQGLLDLFFVLQNTKLRVTQSNAGESRVRAWVYDPDGWAEYLTTAGVAKLSDTKYVAEEYNQEADKCTSLWRFDVSTRRLDLDIVDSNGVNVYSSELASNPLEALELCWSGFTSCLRGMDSMMSDDYERKTGFSDTYAFKLPALQDVSLPNSHVG